MSRITRENLSLQTDLSYYKAQTTINLKNSTALSTSTQLNPLNTHNPLNTTSSPSLSHSNRHAQFEAHSNTHSERLIPHKDHLEKWNVNMENRKQDASVPASVSAGMGGAAGAYQMESNSSPAYVAYLNDLQNQRIKLKEETDSILQNAWSPSGAKEEEGTGLSVGLFDFENKNDNEGNKGEAKEKVQENQALHF
jgi:hypothetical protein